MKRKISYILIMKTDKMLASPSADSYFGGSKEVVSRSYHTEWHPTTHTYMYPTLFSPHHPAGGRLGK